MLYFVSVESKLEVKQVRLPSVTIEHITEQITIAIRTTLLQRMYGLIQWKVHVTTFQL